MDIFNVIMSKEKNRVLKTNMMSQTMNMCSIYMGISKFFCESVLWCSYLNGLSGMSNHEKTRPDLIIIVFKMNRLIFCFPFCIGFVLYLNNF